MSRINENNPYICELSCQCGKRWKFGGPYACDDKLYWHNAALDALYNFFRVLTKLSIGEFEVGFKDEVKGFMIADSLDREMTRLFKNIPHV